MNPVAFFLERTGDENPLNDVDVRDWSNPTFADIDGDGDDDVVVGRDNGTLKYFKNTGSVSNPEFVDQTNGDNPFFGIFVEGGLSAPAFVDLDEDGDLDGVFGGNTGKLEYYENTGSNATPDYVKQSDSNNPFSDVLALSGLSTPVFADLDRDDDLDLVVGNRAGTLDYYENTTSADSVRVEDISYVARTGTDNPFNGIDVGDESRPAFALYDERNPLDLVVGRQDGTLQYYENVAALGARYEAKTNSDNLFDGFDVGDRSAPAISDINNDGDYDVLVGAKDGTLSYFDNRRVVNPSESAQLFIFESDGTIKIVTLGEGNTLQLVLEQVDVSGVSEVLVFSGDRADATDAVQIARFSILDNSVLPGDEKLALTLDKSLIVEDKFLQIKLVEDGRTRTAAFDSISNRNVQLDFGEGTILSLQSIIPNESTNLMVGDADAIDLSARSDVYNLEFSVYREAAYDNTVGFYQTDTAAGGISVNDTILNPGDDEYRAAALDRQLDVKLFGENDSVQTFSAQVQGGGFVGTFLVADGSDVDRRNVYFSHAEANRRTDDHVKLLGDNTFGFEDRSGLGDRDYNDIVVQFTVT